MKLRIYSKKAIDVEQLDFAKNFLGKKVYAKSGDYVGKVKDLVMDKGTLKGYIVKGKKKLFLAKEHFSDTFDEAMMLNIDPVVLLIGKVVFDSEGKRLGKVQDLERSTTANSYASLLVKKTIISKALIVKSTEVDVCKKNIILNVAK